MQIIGELLKMNENDVIKNAMEYVKERFSEEYSGHDYWHALRVYRLASKIAKKEKADLFTVQLAALLHDVDDIKISPDTHEKKSNAVSFMRKNGLEEDAIARICRIINEVSFAGDDSVIPQWIEGKCVQDADRLDAIGAIGIARAFTYGGNHNRTLYDPAEKPEKNMTKEKYQCHISTTINHFYEKLFHLKEMMNTSFAKEIAERRDKIMHDFIEEFLLEWEGKQ